LAVGIDGSAHFGALRGVKSSELKLSAGVAVLGSGVLSVYPSEHTELCYEIIESNGVLVSEYGLYHGPRAYRFLERNRIVSGLSELVIIVEAGIRSGALCTARLANEQGREVFAVPGPIESPTSKGIIQLLKQGAIPFSSFEEALQEISRLTKKDLSSRNATHEKDKTKETKNLVMNLSKSYQEELDNRLSEIVVDGSEMDLARKLMRILANTKEIDLDKLVDEMGLATEKLLVVLSKLQIIGVVEQGAGNTYNLASG
jgi:predicted Rossmann fold nucleotide-binding protein DprA/Smf involved in DNA uptake